MPYYVCHVNVRKWKKVERQFHDLMNFNVHFDKKEQKEMGRVHLIISLD